MAKKTSLFSNFMVFFNTVLLGALFLLMGDYFSIKGLLPGVLVPVLSFINFIFFLYWILRMQWPFLLFVIFLLTVQTLWHVDVG